MDNDALAKIESMLKVLERDLKETNRHFDVNMRLIKEAIEEARKSPAADPVVPTAEPPVNIEKVVEEAPATVPAGKPAAVEKPARETVSSAVPHPHKPEASRKKGIDMEKWVGKNAMGIIASVLIFMSLGVFGAVIFPLLGNEIRFALMLVFSLIIFAFGIFRYEKSPNVFNISLSACGIGAVYVTLLVGRILFNLFGDFTLYGFLFIWTLAAFFLMKRYDSTVFNVIGHLGVLISVFLAASSISEVFDSKMVLFVSVYTTLILVLYSLKVKGTCDFIISTAVNVISVSRILSLFLSHDSMEFSLSYDNGVLTQNEVFLWHDDILLVLSFFIMVSLLVFKIFRNHKAVDKEIVSPDLFRICSFVSMFPVMAVFAFSETFLVGFIPIILLGLIYVLSNVKFYEFEDMSFVFNLFILAAEFMYMYTVRFNGALFNVDGIILESEDVFNSLGIFWIAIPVLIFAIIKGQTDMEALVISVAVPVINLVRYTGGKYSTFLWNSSGEGTALNFIILFLAGVIYTYVLYRYVYSNKLPYPSVVKACGYVNALFLSIAAGQAVTNLLIDKEDIYPVRAIGLCAAFLVIFIVNCLVKKLVKGKDMKILFIVLTSLSSLSGIAVLFDTPYIGNLGTLMEVLCLVTYIFLAVMVSMMIALPLRVIKAMSVKAYSLYTAVGYTLFIFSVTYGLENSYIVSVSFIIWAVICIFMGFVMRVRYTRIYGLVLSIIGVLKLVLFDVSYTNTVGKAVSMLICGILLFIVSYIYNRAEKKLGA